MAALKIPIHCAVDLANGMKMMVLKYPLIRGDDEAHEIIVDIKSGGEAVSLEGAMCKGYALLPDKVQTAIADGSVSSNTASFVMNESFYCQNGKIEIIMRITLGGTIIVPILIVAMVQSGITDTIIDADDIVPSLDELLEKIGACESATSNANSKALLAQEKADAISNMTVAAQSVDAGGNPSVAISDVDGHKHILFGMVKGDTGEQGIQGEQGDQGEQGNGYTILGQAYATVDALKAAITSPAVGDQYNVGATAPYNVWRWTGIPSVGSDGWEDQGQVQGDTGQSAYELAVAGGYEGTQAEWLASLVGAKGDDGQSAYEVAVAGGYTGTAAEWMASLVGAKGDTGQSAYELAVAGGYTGTQSEWLASLRGETGADGQRGAASYHGAAITGTSDTPAAYLTGIEEALAGDRYYYEGASEADVGNVYCCTQGGDEQTALWAYVANLRGATGAAGVYVGSEAPTSGETMWYDPSRDVSGVGALPTGGTQGQLLRKTGADNYAAGWMTPPTCVEAAEQTLTAEQQAQVRANIGAAALAEMTAALAGKASGVKTTQYVYVSKSGSDTTGDGTQANPWATIQHAVDMCPDVCIFFRYVVYIAGNTADTPYAGFSVYQKCMDFRGIDDAAVYISGQFYISNNAMVRVNAMTMIIDYAESYGIFVGYGSTLIVLSSTLTVQSTATTTYAGVINATYNSAFCSIYGSLTMISPTSGLVINYSSRAWVTALAGNVTGTALRTVGGDIRYNTAGDLTAGAMYAASCGGRVYAGAQASAPSY